MGNGFYEAFSSFIWIYIFIYILLAVDYVSKWVEATACPKNDANTVVGFLQRNILSRFGTPRTIISLEEFLVEIM